MTDEPRSVRYVTNQDLREELQAIRDEIEKRPTVWHMRFLILAGILAAQAIPATDVARAALGVLR